jgi:nitrogen-specific signal transduction histidine kinase
LNVIERAQRRPAPLEWVGAAYLTGALSASLVRAERERAEWELHRRAAHALRAPIATIHGLVQVLHRDRSTDEKEEKIVEAIADETGRLLESPLFEEEPR